MNEMPTQPTPPPVPPAGSPRRIYFEQLTASLLSAGVSGARIGEIVAELDDHIAMSGVDPVDELGPVGELAAALAAADADRAPWLWLLVNVVFGVLTGVVIALVLAMFFNGRAGSTVVVDLGLIAYMGAFMIGIGLLRLFGSKSIVGKSTFEVPALKYFLPYILLVGVVAGVTQGLEWSTTLGTAWTVLAIAVPPAVLAGLWSVRRSRIPVPGNVRHLRRLGWGPLGRS